MIKNKFSQYLFYAIGEIVLVVIGILIAIQINDWYKQQDKNKLELILLGQVKDEILSIQNDLENDLSLLKLGQKSSSYITDHLNNKKPYADSLCFSFYFMNKDEYIYPKQAVYDKIKKEGLELIKNDTIAYFLQDLYESHFPRMSKANPFKPDIEDYFSDYFQNNFRPNDDMSLKYEKKLAHVLIKIPRTYTNEDGKVTLSTIGYVPLDYSKLRDDPKFRMLISKTDEFRRYKIGRYNRVKEIMSTLMPMIDRELTK